MLRRLAAGRALVLFQHSDSDAGSDLDLLALRFVVAVVGLAHDLYELGLALRQVGADYEEAAGADRRRAHWRRLASSAMCPSTMRSRSSEPLLFRKWAKSCTLWNFSKA